MWPRRLHQFFFTKNVLQQILENDDKQPAFLDVLIIFVVIFPLWMSQ